MDWLWWWVIGMPIESFIIFVPIALCFVTWAMISYFGSIAIEKYKAKHNR